MPVWPEELEFCALGGSFNETPVDAALRTNFDAGPQKVRPRFTAVPTNIGMTLPWMTRAEYAGFRFWFEADLKFGALAFEAKHPVTRQVRQFRFRQPYQMQLVGNKVSIQVALEMLP